MKRLLAAILTLTLIPLACVAQPTEITTTANVETVVAQTMQALTQDTIPSPAATSTLPSDAPGPLPHTLYYLNNDSAGFLQVHRLERDAETAHQITFESGNVENFAVSPLDGSVAYTSNNQLLLIDPDGSDRILLLDGGPLGSDESYITSRVGGVAWSPDGKTIAFGYGGLNFYSVDTDEINKVLENRVDESLEIPIIREGYSPIEYAPDGDKLLINIGYYEGGVYAIFYLSGNTLVRSEENPVSCCEGSWVPDGNAYYAASPYLGMLSPGLWRIAADGKVDTLLNGEFPGPLDFVQAPILGPDGLLYFFHNSLPQVEDMVSRLPLYMVRSAPDGVSDRTNLIPAPFENINEILWAPNASFAIIATAPAENIYQGGIAEIHYTDGRPSIPLVPFAQEMRWGP